MIIEAMPDSELRNKLRNFVYDIVGCCQEVHAEKGPWLTEYIYQECMQISLEERNIAFKKEFIFHPTYKGKRLESFLRVDFFIKDKVFVECKAIESLGPHERQQLTNYMRNAGVRIGILYNFAPVMAQCEKFYYDPDSNKIQYF